VYFAQKGFLMTEALFFQNWQDKVIFPPRGAQPVFLEDTDKYTVILGGIEAGQKIPFHPEAKGIYYILEGSGVMTVNEEKFDLTAGSIIITPDGAKRGIDAETRLAFMAVKIK